MSMRLVIPAMMLLTYGTAARASNCDLDQLIGYQLITSRTIEGYVDFEQKQQMGFEGCIPGRALVFTDRTGVRCKGNGRQHLELPEAFLFARGRNDMKLCVGDEIYDVGPVR